MGEVIKLRVASSEEAIVIQSASGSLAVEAVSPRASFEKIDGGTRLDITDIDGLKSTVIPDGVAGPEGPAGPSGERGEPGPAGPVGNDGVSPEASVTQTEYGAVVTVTDANGTTTAILTHGPAGDAGPAGPAGPRGETGPAGPSGANGISPVVTTEKIAGGNRITIVDDEGTSTIDVMDGSAGQNGKDGSNGVTFTPNVSAEGILSWSNDGGKANPQSVNIRGPKGDTGDTGPQGNDYVLTAHDKADIAGMVDIAGKTDKVSGAVTGNFAGLDANGNLTDSGSKASDFATWQDLSNELSDKQDTLTSTDKYEIVDFALTSVEFPTVAVQTAGRIVNYTTGTVNVRASCDASVSVDISGFPIIRYSRVKMTNSTQSPGIAFYDADRTFIDGAGIPALMDQSEMGYVLHDVDVPTGAKYARFTMLADTETYGAFKLYGISSAFEKLEQKANKVSDAISGNFAALDSNGNLTDSGSKASDFLTEHQDISGKQDVLTFDSAPTSESTNPVTSGGVYTALQAKADPVTVETVSGTDPVIVGVDNHRYVCGTVDTLTLTPPSSGIVDVVFASGTTPTVLSVPSTVKWPGWFDPSALDASVTYEINIMDGVYGTVMAWT